MKPLPKLAELRRPSGAPRPSRYRISARQSSAAPAEAIASDIIELIRAACSEGSRRAVRIATPDAKGSLFFDSGHIIHAEFGEDYGLRALAPMLRAGPFVIEPWTGLWPSQRSMHLGIDLLLSMVGRETPAEGYQLDTRVIRKVDHRAGSPVPPPLPDEHLARTSSEAPRTTLVRPTARRTREVPPAVPPAAQPDGSLAQPVRSAAESAIPRAGAGEPSSSMVRVSAHGTLLAAHGRHADRLADAAAFIHGLANSISVDLGGSGKAAVHLRGHGQSLFVVRSEVGDIAAAFGRTRRLASLLRKVGLR